MTRMNRLLAAIATWRVRTQDEAGQGLAEYALILALIAVVCIGGLTQLGFGIRDSAGFVALPSAL